MIKRICSILTAVVLTACLTACGDGEISEKEYQSFLSDMGISGVESAVEGAAAMREAYIAYLQSAGYALIEETRTGDVIYAKGSHAVKVLKMNGKVSWNDEVAGQYGLYVFFY